MATLDPQTHDVVSVEPSEAFTGELVEWIYRQGDPENELPFYDVSMGELAYSLMSVLEYLYKNKHSVRITVEDLGESVSARNARERAAQAAKRREDALAKLAIDAHDRQQRMVKYTSR